MTIKVLMRTFSLLSSRGICTELGKQARRLRLGKNLSQTQLAHMTLASLSSVRRLEAQGQGSLEFVVRVMQALQVVSQLESLFEEPAHTIAQTERDQSLALRQRARPPRSSARRAA